MADFILKHGGNGVWYGAFTHFDQLGIKHGISTRMGGVSKQPFHSLNLGLHTGDEEEHVLRNRQGFCQSVGVELAHVVTAQQTHNDEVLVVTAKDRGKGAQKYSEALTNTDALVTNVPGIPLMLFFADCVPVLIVDPVHNAIGIVHGGWKGTAARLGQKTIETMQSHFGTDPQQCLVGIGPSIGPCCYEVDDVVINKIQGQFPNWEKLVHPVGDKWQLDLWQANRLQLEEIGVVPSNIIVSNVCTACNKEVFFSYRAEQGCTGRIGAVLTL